MSYLYTFCKQIRLHVENRISEEDALRQERTAREILQRLKSQSGVVVADEVGMGKTFVALAVAVSVALQNRARRPVVVMVPPSLKEKWPADFELFREKCLPSDLAEKVKWGKAERAVEFLKLLDDPPERRRTVIFVTHGAMSRGLQDKWVKLALIYQALRKRWGVEKLRRALSRVLGDLLRMRWVERNGQEIWQDLLKTHPSEWLDMLHQWDIDPEGDGDPTTDDDPVPRAVWEILPKLETDTVFDCLKEIPLRRSKNYKERLTHARQVLVQELQSVWKEAAGSLRLRLPLLVLDEAHHLKNAKTRLASLFHVPEASEDVEELTRGALGGVFERMLFLTATPFQLGHAELCSVLDRFNGISWKGKRAPARGQDVFRGKLKKLWSSLDAAQEAAVALDDAWGRLRVEDLTVDGQACADVDAWWNKARTAESLTPAAQHVVRCFARTKERMKAAEGTLRPWVIRHLKPRMLPQPHETIRRRRRLPGRAILGDGNTANPDGISVAGRSLLPFLLAARASSHAPTSRPVFAEGLASSYEAFLHTRMANLKVKGSADDARDGDDDPVESCEVTDAMKWYLDQL